MVALTCRDHMTPVSLQSCRVFSKKARSLLQLMNMLSRTSPSCRASCFFSSTLPSLPTNSMRTSPALAMVTDCSLEKKSPPRM
ncbi:hypothetical protein D3C81_1124150 [compost metagenome]